MSACHCTDSPALTPLCICDAESVALAAVQAVRDAFGDLADADHWLHAHSARLGGVPADLIRDGQAAKVVKEARRHSA